MEESGAVDKAGRVEERTKRQWEKGTVGKVFGMSGASQRIEWGGTIGGGEASLNGGRQSGDTSADCAVVS